MENIKTLFQSSTVLHLALVSGQVMIATILFFVIGISPNATDNFMLSIVTCILSVGTIFASAFIHKRKLEALDLTTMNLEEKLTNFRSTSIIKWAMLEGGNLMVVLISWITGNTWLMILFVVSLILLFMAKPTLERFAKEFRLSREEESQLRSALRN